jgi:hypothetical protein
MADLEIDVDLPSGASRQWKRLAEEGGRDAVDQISILAERFMKEEAPEGVGIPNVNMRTTIKPKVESRDPYRKNIAPRKKTEQGWPLHHAIIEGTSYGSSPPPLDPIMAWARAKIVTTTSIREAAEAIRWNIFHNGHDSFPNEFIDRSVRKWEGRSEQIAQDAVDDAFGSGGGI